MNYKTEKWTDKIITCICAVFFPHAITYGKQPLTSTTIHPHGRKISFEINVNGHLTAGVWAMGIMGKESSVDLWMCANCFTVRLRFNLSHPHIQTSIPYLPIASCLRLSGGVLAWLSVWSELQTCICPSWCHYHSLSLASVKSRLVVPFWYRLTWVVTEKGPLNGCVCVCFMFALYASEQSIQRKQCLQCQLSHGQQNSSTVLNVKNWTFPCKRCKYGGRHWQYYSNTFNMYKNETIPYCCRGGGD